MRHFRSSLLLLPLLSGSVLTASLCLGCGSSDEPGGATSSSPSMDAGLDSHSDATPDVEEDVSPPHDGGQDSPSGGDARPDAQDAAPDAGIGDLPPLDHPKLVDFPEADVQVQPTLALNDNGTLLVAWTGKGASSLAIFAQSFDVTGESAKVKTARFPVVTETSGINNEPSVCALHGGGFVVAWSRDTQQGVNNMVVRFRLLDADGKPAGGDEVAVQTERAGNHWLAEVACAPDGGFWIAGVRPDEKGKTFEIFVQRYDDTGNKVGQALTVKKVEDGGGQGFPALAAGPGGTLVVGFENSPAKGNKKVEVRRWDGKVWGTSNLVLGNAGLDAIAPAVAVDWKTQRYVAAAGDQTGIVLRRYEGDKEVGFASPDEQGLTADAALASVGDDRFVVGYFVQNGSGTAMRVGYLDASGVLTTPSSYVAQGKFPLAYRPAIAFGSGTVAAAWTESKGGGKYKINLALFRR